MIEFRQHRIQYQQDMTQMSKRRRMTTNSAKSWAKNAPQCWGYENARVYSPQQLTYIQRANLSTVVCKGGVCVLEMVNTHTHKPEDIFQVPTAIPGAYIRKRRGGPQFVLIGIILVLKQLKIKQKNLSKHLGCSIQSTYYRKQ